MQVICPLLNIPGDGAAAAPGAAGTVITPAVPTQPSASDAVVNAVTDPEAIVDQSVQTGGFEEGFIQIKNTRIYGLRTYSIILIIVLVYSYLCIRNGDVLGMKDLALMACGFLFGVKAIRKG